MKTHQIEIQKFKAASNNVHGQVLFKIDALLSAREPIDGIEPSSLLVMHTAVNRLSRTGAVIGADERITPYQAICSITRNAAYQYFEEDRKGTLKAGKLADFVILDKNPMKIDPMKIIDLQVMETIKEGKTVYKKL